MILSGAQVINRQLVHNLRYVAQQQQPCGVDLTLRQVSRWTSPAAIDFNNTKRQGARTSVLPFNSSQQAITLQPGNYLIDFNETVRVPRNCMASIYPRSSLWRSGVGITAGVVDAGDAKLAQIVFEELRETVEGYNGIYQASTASNGRDGPGMAS